jgi:hypothetical protein
VRFGRHEIDVVHADTGATDDLQALAGIKDLRRDTRATPDNEGIIVCGGFDEIGSRYPGAIIDGGGGTKNGLAVFSQSIRDQYVVFGHTVILSHYGRWEWKM